MFEQEYKRANDRIHPRKDLLKEMEAKWAAEQAQPVEEKGKIVAFPAWARYASMAAGILLCVGLGMGSVLLFSRSRGLQPKTASAEAPMMMAESAVEMEMAEPQIVTETAVESADAMDGMLFEAKVAAAGAMAPEGMHRAADEAEVEDAVRLGLEAADQGAWDPPASEASVEAPSATSAPTPQMKAAAKAEKAEYPAGQILFRDDILAVFLPSAQQVQVIRYADRKVTKVMALSPREKGTEVKTVFWMGSELLILREKDGDTELLRFDVSDWKAPRHRQDLVQSGTFLGAWEMGGKLYILSLYRATEEEPLPWVNGSRMDFDQVLLDGDRPADTYTLVTVYDPQTGDFAAQTALLAEARGTVIEDDRVLLWAGSDETDLYVLSGNGQDLEAEDHRPGTVMDAQLVGEDYSILMETEDGLALLTLDRALEEKAAVAASGARGVRFAQVYEGGAVVLAEDGLHCLTEAGDSVLDVTGDGFCWLSPDRGLVMTDDGKLQLVDVDGHTLVARDTAQAKESLTLAVRDPSRIGYDLASGRLVIPAQGRVQEFAVSEAGEITSRGSTVNFYDQGDDGLWEIRCLMTEDRVLVFYKAGVILCNLDLEKISTTKY